MIRTPAEVQAEIKKFPQVSGTGQQYLSPRLNHIFTKAQKEADSFKDEYISTEHLLLAITEEKDGAAGRILRSHGVSRDGLLKVLRQMRGDTRITSPFFIALATLSQIHIPR